MKKHLSADGLRSRTIDCHSHVGISLKSYSCMEYPYAQSLEGLYYRQKAAGVDVNIVFPLSASLFFDPACFEKNEMRPAEKALSEAPYGIENAMMMKEIFVFDPEHKDRFIPFVCVDPARETEKQMRSILELENDFPIYGIKISPVECQSKITSLLDGGKVFLEYAAERDIPFLLHTTADPSEEYSYAGHCFEIIEKNDGLRFCLAHCIGFHREFLRRAAGLPNVWVDTSALEIQVQCARENHSIMPPEELRFGGDYSDHKKILAALMTEYPDTIMWGTDSPVYTFICSRKQGEDSYREFRLKGSYEGEKAALDFLPEELRMKACNENTLEFLFGAL